MSRFFLELAYHGAAYRGFQVQDNAVTVQAEVEKAMKTVLRIPVSLTGSSRTDTGVHARQNFFHFDFEEQIDPRLLYKCNAILPKDIQLRALYLMPDEAHSRFDAIGRSYQYSICPHKNPFLHDRSHYYPYALEIEKMQEAADLLLLYQDFTSFSKRNTQVKTFLCQLSESRWQFHDECWVYHVSGNRFLRGMVRALTGTLLRVGRSQITVDEFREIIEAKDCTRADFSVPGQGLMLMEVRYPLGYLPTPLQSSL
jgi:tRNA pseudouridine38-40 synthase